jgi:hypothetical protein
MSTLAETVPENALGTAKTIKAVARNFLLWMTICVSIGLIGVGSYFAYQMQAVYDAVNYGATNSTPSLKKLSGALNEGKEYFAFTIRHILNTDSAAMSNIELNIRQSLRNASKNFSDYETLISDSTDRQMLASDNEALAAVTKVIETVLPLSRANKNDQARDLFNLNGVSAIVNFQNALNAHIDYNLKLAEESKNAGSIAYGIARNYGIVAICLSLLLFLTILIILSTFCLKAITKRVLSNSDISQGDTKLNIRKLRRRVAVALFLIAAFMLSGVAGIGYYGISNLSKVYTSANYANENSAPSIALLSKALDHSDDYYEYVLRHVVNTDGAIMRDIELKLDASLKHLRDGLRDYELLISDYNDRVKLVADQNALTDLTQAVAQVLPVSRENKLDQARELIARKVAPAREAFEKVLSDHIKYNTKLADAGNKMANDVLKSARWYLYVSIGVLIVLYTIGYIILSIIIARIAGESVDTDHLRKTVSTLQIVMTVVLITTGISAYFSYTSDQSLILGAKQREMRLVANLIQNKIQEESEKAAATASMVVSQPSVATAFRKGNRDDLIDRLLPTFLVQKGKYGVREAQFIYPPATSFLRLFQIDAGQGEDLSSFREMIVKANREQEAQSGIEVGRRGLSVRGVDVVRDSDGIVGSFEVGLSFSPILDTIKQNSGFDASVFVDDELLSRVAILMPKGDAERIIGGARNVESTDWNVFKMLITPDIISNANDIAVFSKTVSGVDYGMVLVPLLDYAGTQIGTVVAAKSFEDYQTQMTAALVRVITFSILQILVLAGVIVVLINAIFVRPSEQQEQA